MSNFESIQEKIKGISRSRGIKKILFICLGNLCRSPMAECLLRNRLESKGKRDVQISSAGFLDQTGSHSPEEIHVVMNEAGIDVSQHRSSPVTEEKIREADLIIVMEKRQRENLCRQFPDEAYRIFLLSQFDGQNPEERDVTDPIGQALPFYRNCFNEIKTLVEGLTEHILSIN
ncbi:MAG: low molecular weight protein arginine phosphatase [Nitrospinota bacterium]